VDEKSPAGRNKRFLWNKNTSCIIPSGIASCPSHRGLLNPQKESKIERIKYFSKEKEKPEKRGCVASE